MSEDNKSDPVRKWTLILLGLFLVLFFYYLVADRLTPFTAQARVHALVVPIAAEVSGTVADVMVSSNQSVDAGDLLFRLDEERYQLAVETAEASLQSARQATGASAANVDATEAQLVSARAGLVQAEQDEERRKAPILRRQQNRHLELLSLVIWSILGPVTEAGLQDRA